MKESSWAVSAGWPVPRPKVVVWGLLAHAPFGGMTWQVINHLVGLRQLGLDVWYVEDSEARMLDVRTTDWTGDLSENAAFVARHLEPIGMADRWVVRVPGGKTCYGALDWAGLLALYRDSDLVLNLCGSHELRPHHDQVRNLVYIETDPVSNQVALASGVGWKREELGRYRQRVTYATNIGASDCDLPPTELSWARGVPPVALDLWRTTSPPSDNRFTTVMNWSSPEGSVSWNGHVWKWSKRDAFLRVLPLPEMCSPAIEVALRQAGSDIPDLFRSRGWRVLDARSLDSPDHYRRYIRGSMAELSVAKEQYVVPRTGWISDRTVCYLAAGRPAVVERTQISGVPLGTGLLDFADVAEAAEAVEEVVAHYARHAAGASELAEEYFAADKVMAKVLSDAGLV